MQSRDLGSRLARLLPGFRLGLGCLWVPGCLLVLGCLPARLVRLVLLLPGSRPALGSRSAPGCLLVLLVLAALAAPARRLTRWPLGLPLRLSQLGRRNC